MKRIRIKGGYLRNEAVANFRGIDRTKKEETRDLVRAHGKFANSKYLIALPTEYRTTAETLDRHLLNKLKIDFIFL